MSSKDNECNTEELEGSSRSILLHLASQLTKGMDLHRITLPTFVLEPRSMLERITDFMSHPDLLLQALEPGKSPRERFIDVLRYYLSGWHIKPKGVKKPYNPVLGEFFRCRYTYPDGTNAYYLAEQVSHHPPISAYFYTCPEHNISITGEIRPKSKFLGNSAATIMEGYSRIVLNEGETNERYDITMPNVYARGILFGTMTLELGDNARVVCASSGLQCDLEFRTKGYFSGQWNSVYGKIRDMIGNDLYEISGQWSNELWIKDLKTGSKECLFDVKASTMVEKVLQPVEQQEEYESRRLWQGLSEGIRKRDMDMATTAKTSVEDRQRDLAKEREESGTVWTPRFFDKHNDEYVLQAPVREKLVQGTLSST